VRKFREKEKTRLLVLRANLKTGGSCSEEKETKWFELWGRRKRDRSSGGGRRKRYRKEENQVEGKEKNEVVHAQVDADQPNKMFDKEFRQKVPKYVEGRQRRQRR